MRPTARLPATLALMFGTLCAPVSLGAQVLNSGGAKFIKNSDRSGLQNSDKSGLIKKAPARPCHALSPSAEIEFCGEGTFWRREAAVGYDTATLYRLNDNQKAALRVIQMLEGEAAAMTPDQIGALAEDYTFANGPRGPRRMDRLVATERTPDGRLQRLKAFAREDDGTFVLLQVQVHVLKYGLGLSETTMAVASMPHNFTLSQEQIAFDQGFRETVRVAGDSTAEATN